MEKNIIKSLRKISKRKIHTTNIDDLYNNNAIPIPKKNIEDDHQDVNNCKCKLCKKASSRIKPKYSYRKPKMSTFDTKKSFEKAQKDKFLSRVKKASKVKYKKPKFEDPYKTRTYDDDKRRNSYWTGNPDKLITLNKHETSHYKTSKYKMLKNQIEGNNGK